MATAPFARRAAVFALGLLAWAAMGASTGLRLAEATLWDYGPLRRVWQDSAAAISSYLEAAHPMRAERAHRARGDLNAASRVLLAERAYREEVRPWEFWRTVRVEPFLRERGPAGIDAFDDRGRAALMAAGYRLLGGISPFLLFWVGWLAAGPVVVWLVAELFGAGGWRAAATGALLLALSPFLVDAFSLARSAVGFYVLGVLVLCAYAVGATHGRPRPAPLWLRTAGAASLLALCTYCRSGSVLLLPGFALAATSGAVRLARASGHSRRRAAVLSALLVAALALPAVAMRGEGRRDAWLALWEGLGDFDRTRGHVWADEAAEAFLRQRGLAGPIRSDAAEAAFRADVLHGIRHQPQWFAAILARRAAATVLQTRLWPWAPLGRASVVPVASANEGHIRKYYGYVTPVDHVGAGRLEVELPVPLLFAPTLALALLARRGAHADRARRALGAVACVGAGALVLPVAVTTAGAIETQAFALCFALAGPLLATLSHRPPEGAP